MAREQWGSKLGVILAVAGSAVGIGNFLRFPVQAAKNGGGAFMIPYFVALLLLGIPLMWIEWTIGRLGGGFGHSSAPGMFHTMAEKKRFVKYFGVIGIFGPLIVFVYYTYIESWLLAYSVFSIIGKYHGCTTQQAMQSFLAAYQGRVSNEFFASITPAYIFFVITFVLNIVVVIAGIRAGIEKVCKIAMPTLFFFAIILIVRVFALGTPDPAKPDYNVVNGLGFLWNPQWDQLLNAKVWLAAAGQIFFSLSVGYGIILTYASYLSKKDDIALSGLTASSSNEFIEVILGGSIVIPAAFAFFGPVGMKQVADNGAFDLGFVTMPLTLQQMHFSAFFGFLWFTLMFLAGITSSISMAQPAVAFLEDEFNISKKKASGIFALATFVLCQPCIFLFSHGIVDELDFWGGTFCLTVFAAIETILFVWVFGMDKAWTEMHLGSDITIPRAYRFIIKYVTPAFLLIILGAWLFQDGIPTIMMENIAPENRAVILGTRIALVAVFTAICLLVKVAWSARERRSSNAS